MRITRAFLVGCLALLAAPTLRAEYIVLRNGQRLSVTGYQRLGDNYRLQMRGGAVEIPASQVVGIEPEEVFTPVPPAATGASKGPFADLIEAAAKRYDMDVDLITSVIAAESNFNPKAISRRDARGLMQLLPVTAARFGVHDIFDPKENIEAGTQYLSELLKLYNNDLALALAAYNAGPDSVQRFGRVPPFAETISYVRRVKTTYESRKSGTAGSAATQNTAGATPASPPASTSRRF
jgi:soluble lytic murein transglycosylase-like protein